MKRILVVLKTAALVTLDAAFADARAHFEFEDYFFTQFYKG